MTPEWTNDWTIAEAYSLLLAGYPQYQVELPYWTAPANQRLCEVWERLSDDCRLMLEVARNDFCG